MILSCYKCQIFIIVLIIFLTKFKVRSALVLETTVKGPRNESHLIPKFCLTNYDCQGNKQYCNTAIERCECQQSYEYRYDTSDCSPCPEEGERCMDCCVDPNLSCIYNICRCDSDVCENFSESNSSQDMFMNASQIALVAALLMGAAALAMLLYRICTKPSYFGSRRVRLNRNQEANESEFQRVSESSLTSIQIRVISRLRDRPPKYETQHNYDTRIQRQEEEIQHTCAHSNENNNTIPVVNAAEHAPPAYDDGSKESVHESPPPYSATGHDILPDVVVNRNVTHQVGGTSQTNSDSSISIISNSCSASDALKENVNQNNKDDKSIHM